MLLIRAARSARQTSQRPARRTTMADTTHHDNHGQTPAAWTSVTIIMVGFIIGCIAVIQLNWVLLGVGGVVIVLGAVVGKVMQMMGMGKQTDDAEPASLS
jgi:Flp pilus assembly protein TadB